MSRQRVGAVPKDEITHEEKRLPGQGLCHEVRRVGFRSDARNVDEVVDLDCLKEPGVVDADVLAARVGAAATRDGDAPVVILLERCRRKRDAVVREELPEVDDLCRGLRGGDDLRLGRGACRAFLLGRAHENR